MEKIHITQQHQTQTQVTGGRRRRFTTWEEHQEYGGKHDKHCSLYQCDCALMFDCRDLNAGIHISSHAGWNATFECITYLQYSHLLAVAKQAEGEGVFMVEAGADLAASQGQRGNVALQVVPVLMEEQLVVFETAPALPPAIIGQHVQVAC